MSGEALFDDATADERKVLEELWEVVGWPRDEAKDLAMLRRLATLYPSVGLYEEAVGWALWMSEHRQKKEVKHRARFRNWCANAVRFRVARTSGRRHHAAEPGGHGETVEARRDW